MSSDLVLVSNILPFLTTICSDIQDASVKCHNSIQVKWPRYLDTIVTDPTLVSSKVLYMDMYFTNVF